MQPAIKIFRLKVYIYRRHEEEKKGSYNERIINVERGTFTPLVFSTTGGMALECHKYHKRLAGLIAAKTGERYQDTINYIRKKIRFSILRTTLIAARGTRTKPTTRRLTRPVADVDFGLIEDPSPAW